MFEILLGMAMVVAIVKIATADDLPGATWAVVAIGLLLLCLVIPLPFIRVIIAGVLAFCTMIAYKVYANA